MAEKKPKKAIAQRIRITLKSFDHTIIDKAVKMIIDTAERSGAIIAGPIPLPTKIKKITVNKSTFISKNSREQFEMRVHKRLIDLRETTATTIDALSNLTLPAGVDIEIKML
ncbi:30S ribosomal protein S10 [Candidatus Peregrinibacteria bacterium]|nr:30S ribosomal protein S10 [Candidatus Peregrinibacteria bacterium]